MKNILSSAFIAWLCMVVLGLYGCGNISQQQPVSRLDEAWNPANDPQLFAVSNRHFDSLARAGHLPSARYPWTDTYWPTAQGGIALRWQDPPEPKTGTYKDYRYSPYPKERFQGNSEEVKALVDKLSPAEKYDLYLGRYDFPLVQTEFERQLSCVDRESGDVPRWVGICDGWAAASLHEPEPGAVAKMTNADGLEIPFYTSDIDALMTKVYAANGSEFRFLGRRCNTPGHAIRYDELGRVNIEDCRDVNPGSFHLALVSMLAGPEPHGFIADMTPDAPVWNHPITGFRVRRAETVAFEAASDPLASVRAPGTATLVKVKLDLDYAKEIAPHKEPNNLLFPSSEAVTIILEYTLELDRNGEIIGGEWTSSKHPDFLWDTKGQPRESDLLSYSTVKAIAAASRLPPRL